MRTPSWSITGSWLACGLVMAGCQFDPSGFGSPGGDDDDDGAKVDASPGAGDAATLVDAGVVGKDGGEQDGGCVPLVQLPFEPSNFKACDVMAMNDLPPLNGPATGPDDAYKIDTDSEMLTRGTLVQPLMGRVILQMDSSGQKVGPDIFLVATDSLTITSGAKLLVTGSRALVLVASGDITVDGGLSVGVWDSSTGAEQDGSGGDHAAACGAGRGPDGAARTTTDGESGGAGGGGGAFGGSGGRGGEVENSTDPSKTAGGEAGGSADLAPLRGGCAGGRGGTTGGGAGGHAGGALQLVAGGSITVGGDTGIVTAHGGAGMAGAPDSAGGGGGGSGGGILLEASRIEVTGAVTANGGGGGEGTRQSDFPRDGEDGHESDDVAAAGGAGGSVSGGDGGRGGARGRNGEDGKRGDYTDPLLAGGGGGGGSAGKIRIHTFGTNAALGGATFSPDPVVSSTP